MNDLISRSALLKKVSALKEEYLHPYIVGSILQAPAVDAVEVVRCKDCKWYQLRKWDDGAPEYDCRKTHALLDVKADDFCSYGERRNGDVK